MTQTIVANSTRASSRSIVAIVAALCVVLLSCLTNGASSTSPPTNTQLAVILNVGGVFQPFNPKLAVLDPSTGVATTLIPLPSFLDAFVYDMNGGILYYPNYDSSSTPESWIGRYDLRNRVPLSNLTFSNCDAMSKVQNYYLALSLNSENDVEGLYIGLPGYNVFTVLSFDLTSLECQQIASFPVDLSSQYAGLLSIYGNPTELLTYASYNFTTINVNNDQIASGSLFDLQNCYTLSYDYDLSFFTLCDNQKQWVFNRVDFTITEDSIDATLTPIVTSANPLRRIGAGQLLSADETTFWAIVDHGNDYSQPSLIGVDRTSGAYTYDQLLSWDDEQYWYAVNAWVI